MRFSDWSSDVCSSDLYHRARHGAAAEHAIHFWHAGRRARLLLQLYLIEPLDTPARGATDTAATRFRGRRRDGFDQRVPGATIRALSDPFRTDRTAVLTDVLSFDLCHAIATLLEKRRTGDSAKVPADVEVRNR